MTTTRDARTDYSNHQHQPLAADPFSAAITAAVDAAIAARLPAIIEAIRALPKEEPPKPDLDRFIPMREVAKVLGCVRSTVHRRAAAGVYPPLRKQGASSGYYASDMATIMAKPEDAAQTQQRSNRGGRHVD
jgi:predicted DNA-binding transcriptional regulator AlpA